MAWGGMSKVFGLGCLTTAAFLLPFFTNMGYFNGHVPYSSLQT